MADRNALGFIGLMLGAATMFVVSVGAVVVTDNAGGRLQMADSAQVQLAASAPVMTAGVKAQ